MRSISAVLYDGDFGGIFSSLDAGRSWKLNANQVALKGKNVISLAVSPVNSRLLFAGTYEGLLKSEDGGLSWRPVTGAWPVQQLLRRLRAARPRLLRRQCGFLTRRYSTFDSQPQLPTRCTLRPLRGSSRVQTMARLGRRASGPVSAGAVYKVVLHASDPNWIIAQSSNRVYVSGDRGTTWTEARLGDSVMKINDLTFGGAPGRILAGTSHGLFESVDGGKSWNRGTSGLPVIPVSQFNVSRKQPSLMYFLSQAENQVYRSTDGGEHWTRFDDGGLRGLSIQSMAPGSAQMADLFVLTENQGVLAYRPDLASGSGERAVAEVNR